MDTAKSAETKPAAKKIVITANSLRLMLKRQDWNNILASIIPPYLNIFQGYHEINQDFSRFQRSKSYLRNYICAPF